MLHELLEFFEKDKLGAALLLILFALVGLVPAQVLRILRSVKEKDEPRPLPHESGKRLALLEAERERRTQDHFRKLHDISSFVTELGFKVNEMQKDITALNERVHDGEIETAEAAAEFRERLLTMELSATAFVRDARAARKSLERPALMPGQE